MKKGKPSSVRVEYRAADAACNPYLTLSVILAAGLAGIKEGYELPPEISANIHLMTPAERGRWGEAPPRDFVRGARPHGGFRADRRGPRGACFDWFLRNKRKEWDRYQHHVSRGSS